MKRLYEKLLKYRHTWIIFIYGVCYLLAFYYLEHRQVEPHLIHLGIDDRIPFCEYFVIPYLLWYLYVGVTVFYFAFVCKKRQEYDCLIQSLGIGMTVFLIVSYLFPNGHDLRPELTGSGFFIDLVRDLYALDTSTNILPSIHAFNSVACCVALLRHTGGSGWRWVKGGASVLTVLIVMATVCLKQHTIVDVIAALALNGLCYELFYRGENGWWKRLGEMVFGGRVLTVPNLLSFFRIVMAFWFLEVYRMEPFAGQRWWLAGIFILSGLTDMLDGKIARRFHMISNLGKVLDPVADKITQALLLYCLLSRYELARYVFALLVVKELCMAVIGARTLMRTGRNDGALWYGKVSTAVFYVVMAMLLLGPGISDAVANALIAVSGICLLMSFLLYMHHYWALRRQGAKTA